MDAIVPEGAAATVVLPDYPDNATGSIGLAIRGLRPSDTSKVFRQSDAPILWAQGEKLKEKTTPLHFSCRGVCCCMFGFYRR